MIMNCDGCKYYDWYLDYCYKWKCEVDPRSVYDCYEHYEANIFEKLKQELYQLKKSTYIVQIQKSSDPGSVQIQNISIK